MLHSEFLLSRRPGVANARDAKDWLRDLPLTDARAAHHALETLVAEFDETGLDAGDRLEILETVRAQRIEIDAQYATRYTGKPLPLGQTERGAYEHALSLWQRLEEAYWYCARVAASGDSDLRPRLALCVTRATDLACARLTGALRAGQVPDASIMEAVGRYAEFAREHGVLATPAPDSLHPKRFVTAASVQNRALLLGMIGGTASGRERECAFDLAAQWEGKVATTWLPSGLTRPLTRADLPPAADAAKQKIRIVHGGGRICFLDVTALSRSLRKRIHLLGLGQPLSEMGLPASFHHAGAAALLTRLHGAWCEEEYGRRHLRSTPAAAPGTRPAVTLAHGAEEFTAMYCLVSGEPFSANDDASTRLRADQMHVFQGGGHARRDHLLREAKRHIEEWTVLDQSEGGARLGRRGEGARFKPGQLVAFRPAARGGDGPAILAELRWLSEGREGVEAGIEHLVQAPRALALRLTGVATAGAKHWVSAFGAKASSGAPLLIAPAGWYKPNRVVELREGDRTGRWLMGTLKRRGADYELIEGHPTA